MSPLAKPPRPAGPGRAATATLAAASEDRIERSADAPGREHAGPSGVALLTSRTEAAAIAAGAHQVRTVDGRRLTYPSQDLARIESLRPDRPGQTHALERHVGTTLADNVARLRAAPLLHAAGSYTSVADAQYATDETIANPGNQAAIGAFLCDPGRLKVALARVDLGRSVGTSTLQRDVAAGRPTLVPGTTATIVLIRDGTFPEGYRVLTSYPDTRPPELDARGTVLP
jgi:hypothetical protein